MFWNKIKIIKKESVSETIGCLFSVKYIFFLKTFFLKKISINFETLIRKNYFWIIKLIDRYKYLKSMRNM